MWRQATEHTIIARHDRQLFVSRKQARHFRASGHLPGRLVRLILDGTVVRVRLDRKATSISLLVVIGVREDGQKVMLAVKNMGGELPKPGERCSTI